MTLGVKDPRVLVKSAGAPLRREGTEPRAQVERLVLRGARVLGLQKPEGRQQVGRHAQGGM